MQLHLNNRDVNLKLTTRSLVNLEQELHRNPLEIFLEVESGKLPKVQELSIIIKHMANCSIDEAYRIIDDYCVEHQLFDIVAVMVEVFQECGFLAKDTEEKNL